MRNKAEVSLSNPSLFPDVTAWRALRNVERGMKAHSPVEQPKPINRIAELNGQLSTLWQQKKTGEISPKEYRTRQQELASILHEAERQRGHRSIRTKKIHRVLNHDKILLK